MDKHKASYVFRYYEDLMNVQERAAHRHLVGTIKSTHGRSDTAGIMSPQLEIKLPQLRFSFHFLFSTHLL